MPSERTVRQALIAIIGDRSIAREVLLEAVSTNTTLGSPTALRRMAERLLQRDMAFAEIPSSLRTTTSQNSQV